MTGLVLHLGHEDGLASQAGCANPVTLRLHADDLGVRVLGDLPDQRLAVRVRHPVARLDALVGVDEVVEQARIGWALGAARPGRGGCPWPQGRSRCAVHAPQYDRMLHRQKILLLTLSHMHPGARMGAWPTSTSTSTRTPTRTTTAPRRPPVPGRREVRGPRESTLLPWGRAGRGVARGVCCRCFLAEVVAAFEPQAFFAKAWRAALASPPEGVHRLLAGCAREQVVGLRPLPQPGP